jgi:hypothetical protein
VPDRIWEDDPELKAEADAERERYRQSQSKPNGADDTSTGLGEWDAGEDDGPIPPRGWLLGNVLCRRFVSSLLAGGGVGKTALRVAQALALATGRPLTGEHVFQRGRVLLVSLEDGADELRRRLRAAMLHHGVSRADIAGWLFPAAPGLQSGKLVITEKGVHRSGPLLLRLVEVIKRRAIDAVIIDPLVKAHGVEENSNPAMDFVVGTLASVAVEHDCAVDAPHHLRKGTPEAGNADQGRGGGAFKDGARLNYTLTTMTEEEAKSFGVGEDERHALIRMDSAKVNITRAGAARWFRIVGVRIGNGTELYPNGDEVQTVEPWTPPATWEGLSSVCLNAALSEIDAGMESGERFSGAARAGKRAAWPVVQRHVDKTEAQSREIIRTWMKNGVLIEELYDDPVQRKKLGGLRLDPTKRPS